MSTPLSVRLALEAGAFQLDVDFETGATSTGVFGPSGAGKSSLLECVAGLRRGARGRIGFGAEVWLESASGAERPPEARGIGYVPQDGLLFPHRSVAANLAAGARRARAQGVDLDALLARVTRVLELESLLARGPAQLSGGERRRVALGRALCSGPRLLLLDEPFAGLDLPLRRRLMSFLGAVRAEFADLPMLLVSHDPIEVQALCGDLVVLEQGRVVAQGDPRRVLTDPAVFPLAQLEGFENVLPCSVLERAHDTARVGLGGPDGPQLLVQPTRAPVGTRVLVGVPAHEILVASEAPRGLSARNVIPATVVSVETAGRVELLRAEIIPGTPWVAVELTQGATRELALGPGTHVHLVLKATACRVYA